MNSILKRTNQSFKRGTIIRGKWNNQAYRITRVLGIGAVGTVYLCQANGRFVAVKVSDQQMAMAAEVKVLQSLQKVQDARLGPSLLDVDDWAYQGRKYYFYAMEYIQGVNLRTFIRNNHPNWIGIFLLQMLKQLQKLHEAGWVFGDLKNDNIIVSLKPPTIRLIDVGGTTKMGRSIKEYSNFYDRAYWLLGKRVAEPSYDLFALVMVAIAIFYPKTFKRRNNAQHFLRQRIDQVSVLRTYRPCLLKALHGRYGSAQEMHDELLQIMLDAKKKRKTKAKVHMAETVFLLVPTGAFWLFYYLFHL